MNLFLSRLAGSRSHGRRHWRVVCIVIGIALLPGPSLVHAQNIASAVPREHHAWGKFKPGAWILSHTTTETLDAQGKVSSTSIAETRMTLVAVDEKGVELRIERLIEVAGKRFEQKPVVVRQSFSGAENGQTELIKQLDPIEIELDGKKVPCEVRHVEIKRADMTRNIKVMYSAKHSPYVLRREIDEKGGAGKAYQSITNVTAIDMPYRVLNNIKSTAHSQTVLRDGKSVVRTLSVMTMDVPGGIVMESSKTTNLTGQVISQTTVELTDYGLEPRGESATAQGKNEKRERFPRWRARREARRTGSGSTARAIAPEPADAAGPEGPTIEPVSRRAE